MKKINILIAILFALVSSGAAYASEYVVQKGDCLSKIGNKYSVGVQELARLNAIENPDLILIGQKLQLPDGTIQTTEINIDIISGAHKILTNLGISIENIPDTIYDYKDSDIGTHKYQKGFNDAKMLLGFPKNAIGKYIGHASLNPGDRILMTSSIKTVRLYGVKLTNSLDVLEYTVYLDNQEIGQMYWIRQCFNWYRCITSTPKKIREETIEEIPIPEQPTVEIPEQTEPITPLAETASEIPEPVVCKGPSCPMEIERNLGTSFWVHDPDSHQAKTFGHNFYGEMLLWKNLKNDCSSEYWFGLGGYGSYYDYDSAHQPTGGDGHRLAGQIGIRRFYKNYHGMNRQFQIKYRLGYEKSEWGSTKLHEEIKQSGLVNGIYFEYIPEIIKYNLDLVIQLEGWTGFNQHVSAPKEWHVGSASRTFVSSFVGVDWKINPRTTLRIGAGPEFEGVEDSIIIAPRIELQRKLPKNWGRIIVGTSAKFYLNTIGNTYIGLVRYEGDALEISYENFRLTYGGKQVGYGIGGTQLVDEEI